MPSVHNCITITFQYISCYCLSLCKETIRRRNLISIHLMLLFIGINSTFETKKSYISIHLMLLFIEYYDSNGDINKNFNTSHVTVYRIRTVWVWKHNGISIHLMLLFIFVSAFLNVFTSGFQYISCYCLSGIS